MCNILNNIKNTCNTHTVSLSAYHHALFLVSNTQLAAIDSGCSTHTLREDAYVASRTINQPTKVCGTPTGNTMTSTTEAILDFPSMPTAAKKANVYLDL